MPRNRFAAKVVLHFVPVLLVFAIALIIGQPTIITGGGEMVFGFFLMIFWPLSSIISCFLQARRRTRWMWFTPFISPGLLLALQLQVAFQRSLTAPIIDYEGLAISLIVFSLVPSLFGLFLGLVFSRKTRGSDVP